MRETKLITFIGGGNMAQAIILGLLKQGYPAQQLQVSDPNQDKRDQFQQQGLRVFQDNQLAVEQAEVILLAVKPQMIADVCQQLASLDLSKKLIISIAAGINLTRLQQLLPTARYFVRVMPNTPALVSKGMAGLYAEDNLPLEFKQFASDLLQAVGEICWLQQEQQMHAVTAGSGSSPAYFFLLMEGMEKALQEMGLTSEQARQLIQQSALGAAQIVINNPQLSFAQLRQNVTSKGGTTAAALAIFEQQQFIPIVQQAMQACVNRSQQMETEF